MKGTISTVSEIRSLYEKYNYIGIRGLSGRDTSKKYRVGQFLACSNAWWDGELSETLDGTCACLLHVNFEGDWDDGTAAQRIMEALNSARKYADSDDDICIVAGNEATSGDDELVDEAVISNDCGWKARGAIYCGRIDVRALTEECIALNAE